MTPPEKQTWSIVFKRDARQWRLDTWATIEQLEQLNKKHVREGFIPCDVIRLVNRRAAQPKRIGKSDESTPRFAALWCETYGERIAVLDITDTQSEHNRRSQIAFSQGLGQYAQVRSTAKDKSEFYMAIYGRPQFGQVNGTTTVQGYPLESAELMLKEHLPINIEISKNGTMAVGIWQNNHRYDAQILTCKHESALKSKSHILAQVGYWPVSISVSNNPDDKSIKIVSIWHRSKLLAEHEANIGIMQLLNKDQRFWNLLKSGADNTIRTALIQRLAREQIPISVLQDRLNIETDHGVRIAIILAMGEYNPDTLATTLRDSVIAQLTKLFNDDPFVGIHSACQWTLKQWNVKAESNVVAFRQMVKERNWYVDSQGHTLALFRNPAPFKMGTRKPSTSMSPGDETWHTRNINRNFALATKEVTWSQFAKFRPEKPNGHTYWYSSVRQNGRLNQRAPQNQVSWFAAAAYCNWLSRQEGIPKDQWCYVPNENGEYGPGMKMAENYLQRTGYRLPTDAEWEYATRSATTTTWFFGQNPDMLQHYSWHLENSNISTQSVGQLKPNDSGMFDVYGNVWEWTQTSRDEPWPEFNSNSNDSPSNIPLSNRHLRMLRGGSFINPDSLNRSAVRSFNTPGNELFTIGFRIARTLPD